MAFDVDLTTYQAAALDYFGKGREFVLKQRVDFSVAANYLATTKLMAIMLIPKSFWIEHIFMNVITVDASVSDVEVGLYTTAAVAIDQDGFLDGATLVSTGWVTTVLGVLDIKTTTTGVGYLSSTVTPVVTIYNADADTINEAVVDFVVIGKDLSF